MTKHVVMFSGGLASYGAAAAVVERYGTKGTVLLFCDTQMEDEDLYRFIHEAGDSLGLPLTVLAEGRDPWQTFFDSKFLGNTRIDPCSRILKREITAKWLAENCNPESTTIYLGYDWTEMHRHERSVKAWAPWRVESPLCEEPYTTRTQLTEQLRRNGIEPPRLYAMGFQHNNCGGFCIKAGQGAFVRLLENFPVRYAYHEEKEEEFRQFIGKDVAILRDRRGGATLPLTLRALRQRFEANEAVDVLDEGGCACFEDPDALS